MALIFRNRWPLLRNSFHNLATFTTAAEPVQNNKTDSIRTSETNPGKHTKADIGKFYQIPNALEELFKVGGWTRKFKENCETFNEACVMVRKPGLEIIHYLRNTDYNRPVNRYVIYGRKGTGKTMIMSYVLHYAYLQGWLIVHLPWVPIWLSIPKEVTNSSQKGFVDLNARALQWLLHFKSQNITILNQNEFPIGNSYQWNIRESSEAGATLLSVVDYGISRGSCSSDVILAVLSEIKQLCRNGKSKCLVLIDGYNALFHSKSKIKNPEKMLVPPDKVTVLNAFRDMAVSDWHNAAVIVTCDPVAVVGHAKSHLPLYQLTLKGYEHLYPFIPINVSNYSELEINNMLKYYKQKNWLRDEEGFDELKALSGYNGYELMEICGPL